MTTIDDFVHKVGQKLAEQGADPEKFHQLANRLPAESVEEKIELLRTQIQGRATEKYLTIFNEATQDYLQSQQPKTPPPIPQIDPTPIYELVRAEGWHVEIQNGPALKEKSNVKIRWQNEIEHVNRMFGTQHTTLPQDETYITLERTASYAILRGNGTVNSKQYTFRIIGDYDRLSDALTEIKKQPASLNIFLEIVTGWEGILIAEPTPTTQEALYLQGKIHTRNGQVKQ